MESRRPDALLLVGGGVLVIELKGKLEPSQADIDQAAAYRATCSATTATVKIALWCRS